MRNQTVGLATLVLFAEALWASAGPTARMSMATAQVAAGQVPLEHLSPRLRDRVRPVLEKPTLFARGPADTFYCQPRHYFYFLEHPDRAVTAWRRLGAQCVTISERGDGLFGWRDEHGSEVVWQTIHSDAGRRVWFAEGKVRPAPLLPLVPVRAVLALRHSEGRAAKGEPVIQHQADLFVLTDSKTAAVVTKMLGNSTTRVAEQGLTQLQLFFSALSWYLDRNPAQADALLGKVD
jgi:hypothetical protein